LLRLEDILLQNGGYFEDNSYFCTRNSNNTTKLGMVLGKENDIHSISQTLSDVWELLTEEEQQLLVNLIKIKDCQKNEVIYHMGDEPTSLFCIVKGKVKLCKEGVGGRQQITRMVKPKEFFGYRASFVNQAYTTDAYAFEETILLYIPLPVAKKIITQNNAVSIYFLKELAFYLGMAEESTVNLTQKHIRGRLAETLIHLKKSFGLTEDGQTLAITASREDLANLSNMTTSNAIRTLSAFAQEGLVKIDGRHITILDEKQLVKVSEIG
jgi:CRP-like cAMP-binding protein